MYDRLEMFFYCCSSLYNHLTFDWRERERENLSRVYDSEAMITGLLDCQAMPSNFEWLDSDVDDFFKHNAHQI